MSTSPTSLVISIVTTSADDTAVHFQDVVHLRDLAEAMACFPTPEQGHVSPDSMQTCYHSLDQETCIRNESHGPEGMEGSSMTVEGGADSEGHGEVEGPTRAKIVECKCSSFHKPEEFCDHCQGQGGDERDKCICRCNDKQCICVG